MGCCMVVSVGVHGSVVAGWLKQNKESTVKGKTATEGRGEEGWSVRLLSVAICVNTLQQLNTEKIWKSMKDEFYKILLMFWLIPKLYNIVN